MAKYVAKNKKMWETLRDKVKSKLRKKRRKTALVCLDRVRGKRYWYEDVLNHNRLMDFPEDGYEHDINNEKCRERLIRKIKEEGSFKMYPLVIMDICEALSMQNGLQVHFADYTSGDVSTLMCNPGFQGVLGVFVPTENLIRVAEPNRPQRALRTEKHEYMHHFISLLPEIEVLEIFACAAEIISELKNEILNCQDNNKGIKFLKEEIFIRVDSNKEVYGNIRSMLEEYVVGLAEIYLYCEQHPDRKKAIMGLIRPFSNWFTTSILPKMEKYIRNHPKKNTIIIPDWVEKRLEESKNGEKNTYEFPSRGDSEKTLDMGMND